MTPHLAVLGVATSWLCRLLCGLALIALINVPATASDKVPGDRWLEIDLYWFDPAQPERSAETFWQRYEPLYRGVTGYKGAVLSIGLTANYILTFSGNLDQEIALPKTGGQEVGHNISGQLEGDTVQRQRAWRARFSGPASGASSISYRRWTYRDLRRLTDAMRRVAKRRGIADFRMASFAVGQDGSYGDPMPFALRHPEAFTRWRDQAPGALASSSHLDPANTLRADSQPLASLPDGIPEGLPLHALFAGQWGALSKATGLDGLMLRDSMTFPRAYTRYGPSGATVPDAATAERSTQGLAALIRGAKQANPRTLIMAYSTAATATSDWRANGIDLERIAREGYLDIFVDQSWAGAWGEVGVREQTFWNAPILGWTYQLGNILQHAAVLADTKVRHYPLIEAFDAWESWDTIHTAPDRLRWAIWAYSHAGVKTPQGLRMPAGAYISWAHHGETLLSEPDVAFLSREMNAAAIDAASTIDIAGPTMVYSRDAMAAQMVQLSPGFDVRDRTDEQVGSIIQWPLPILSATRAEWVPQVKSDLFLFGATEGMPNSQIEAIETLARSGQPMAFFGAVAGATDRRLANLLGVTSARHQPLQQDRILQAASGLAARDLSLTGAPHSFASPPTATRNTAPADGVVYAFGASAGLVLSSEGALNLSLWDPAPLADYWYRPMRDLMYGEPAPFAYASATLNRQLARRGKLSASTDVRQTGTIAGWSHADGTHSLLAGNLAEGFRDDGDRGRVLGVRLPAELGACVKGGGNGEVTAGEQDTGKVNIVLPPQGSLLLRCARD